jgi:photosystem II stability/assembly factor-like uncharacterized protein
VTRWLRSAVSLLSIFFSLIVVLPSFAQQVDPSAYQELRWRMIGPFRGGRTRAAAGVPSQPNVFYIGVCNGGVWKSTDYGRTWNPIFDDQPTGSIGAIAVAPSDPNIIYVGSGEGLQRPDLSTGDGMYKSTDAGKSWTHLGLRDGQQIPQIAVDPHNPNRLFVAVLGHPYGPNAERGIFRSTDGGQSFQKVLFKDENTGGDDVALDPRNPDTVYATLWEARQGPWENAAWGGSGGGIFKSTDGGNTWKQLTKGLPEGLTQAHLDIAPSDPNRIYASVATAGVTGIYRSDDAGESWTQITKDPRPAQRIGGGDLPVPKVDPKNPDIVYSASVVTWKSTDGGKTWTGIRGAPGGDDYQNIWINPNNPDIILIPGDQGAILTVNGGATWSSWFNQPTAQLYHVGVDNAFPYRVCSGQQESGSVCIASRGNDGEINFRDWHPVGAEEYGYVAPDPLNPDVIYGGKISRHFRQTGQTQNISPKPLRGADFRVVRTEPVVFSPAEPHTLYFASNVLWRTRDGGNSWDTISPDLTRKTWDTPASVGKYRDEQTAKPAQRGVIYAVAPSPLDANRIWIGTDDGLIHLTTDGGKNWTNVTPSSLGAWQKVSIIDAGHFDAQAAYAAINTLRLDDLRPHILRTHDGGKTWSEIVSGIPAGETVNAVREDTKRKGLLFASTERTVYVSFDDGDHWQSLRLNLPVSSVRDLVIKDADLVIATHGRSFWILDDISPLRQAQPAMKATLFNPAPAMRVRWNTNTDTPIPPDVPAGQNPPDGAVIDYFLPTAASAVKMEILDAKGAAVRTYASTDQPEPIDPNLAIPTYWVRRPRVLSTAAGMHRWLWDLHLQPAPAGRPQYPMQAVLHDTPPAPSSPWVLPGQYSVRLTVDGQTMTQPIGVTMDPRVKTPENDLDRQFTLSKQLYDQIVAINAAMGEVRTARSRVAGADAGAIQQKIDAVAGREPQGFGGGGRFGGGNAPETLTSIRGSLATLLGELQGADVAPTAALVQAANEKLQAAPAVLAKWNELKKELPQ